MRRRSRPSPRASPRRAGRGGAPLVGAAVAVPLLRRRLRIPAPVTIAACAGGPLALAVLCPRSKKRDVALFAMQMWAFIMVHEIPYDDPERLRARLRSRYPIVSDRVIGGGRLPNTRLQQRLARLPRVGARRPRPHLDPLALVLRALRGAGLILVRHNERFPRAARQMAARLRPRLRRLLRGADGAALVGLGAGPDRRRGAADHGRGRRGHLGLGLAEDVRRARRQPLGGDALAALRHLAGRRALARRSRQGRGRARLDLRRRRSASPSSTSASTTSPTCSPGRRWWPWSGAASRSPSRSSHGVSRGLRRLERLASG